MQGKNDTRPVMLNNDDRALLLALLAREKEIGPLDQSLREVDYRRAVMRVEKRISAEFRGDG